MHFYGQSHDEVMRLPLRTFWSLNANINRLRAEEQLPMIELFLLGGMGASQEAITALRDHLNKQIGETAKTKPKPVKDNQQSQEGIRKLRELKSRMRN